VFEKTALSWAQGTYIPDIRELTPDTGVPNNTQFVRDAYNAIFAIEFFETKRSQVNKDFVNVYLDERVHVKQDWLYYFKNLLSNASNNTLRFDQKHTGLSAAGGGGDMVIRYRKEGYFKLVRSTDNSEKHVCIAPELPSLFIVEDQASISSLHSQAQRNSRGRPIERGEEEDEEEEEEEEEEKKGWKCSVM